MTRTYRVTVDIQRRDEMEDRAVVTVNGHTYRYPWHWESNAKSLARRAVWENYRVERIEDVSVDRRGTVPGGSFVVTAEV